MPNAKMSKMQYLHDELTWEKSVENKKILFSQMNMGTFLKKNSETKKLTPKLAKNLSRGPLVAVHGRFLTTSDSICEYLKQ